jgi:hypothetical protein
MISIDPVVSPPRLKPVDRIVTQLTVAKRRTDGS